MSDGEIRIGVIGAGGRGGLARLAHRPDEGIRLVAGCDVSPAARDRFRERMGDDVFVTDDYNELLAREDISAIFVTTPDFLHEEHALAADLARRACELSDEDADRAAALIHEGLCRLDLGELEQAEAALVEADEFTDDHAYVSFQRGRVQFVWRDYIEALERFEEALEQGSEKVPHDDMLYEMALCHINIEEYADARKYLLRHQEADSSTVLRFYRGVCDHGEEDYEAARAHFEESLRLGPAPEDLGRVLFYVGACLKELERFDEAIEVLERAVEVDPDDIVNHNLLGFCYYKVKRHQDAVACFERCVQIDPRSGIDWANLGSNLRDLDRPDEAVAMYEKAVSLDKSIGFAWTNLAKLQNGE